MCAGDGWPVPFRRGIPHGTGSLTGARTGAPAAFRAGLRQAPEHRRGPCPRCACRAPAAPCRAPAQSLPDAFEEDDDPDGLVDPDGDGDADPSLPLASTTEATASSAAFFAFFIRPSASGVLSPAKPAPL
ncbi:hypothetical protein SUDANB70_02640 [Streptomyces sp. enrichment culture]